MELRSYDPRTHDQMAGYDDTFIKMKNKSLLYQIASFALLQAVGLSKIVCGFHQMDKTKDYLIRKHEDLTIIFLSSYNKLDVADSIQFISTCFVAASVELDYKPIDFSNIMMEKYKTFPSYIEPLIVKKPPKPSAKPVLEATPPAVQIIEKEKKTRKRRASAPTTEITEQIEDANFDPWALDLNIGQDYIHNTKQVFLDHTEYLYPADEPVVEIKKKIRLAAITSSFKESKKSGCCWSNSYEGKTWKISWDIFYNCNSTYRTSKIVLNNFANKTREFDYFRTVEIIQYTIFASKRNDFVHHGIILSMFFKMLYCMDLQAALLPSDPYVTKVVKGRKIGSERRPGKIKKPKCVGLALPRPVPKRGDKEYAAHIENLSWLCSEISSILGMDIKKDEVPSQNLIIDAVSTIINVHDVEILLPFGEWVGMLWTKNEISGGITKLPSTCDIHVWEDIKLVGKIVSSYDSCVRRGSVMGTIVGDIGFSPSKFLPPFLGEAEITGDSESANNLVAITMYGKEDEGKKIYEIDI